MGSCRTYEGTKEEALAPSIGPSSTEVNQTCGFLVAFLPDSSADGGFQEDELLRVLSPRI